MAEQVVNSVTLAVTGELTSRVFSRLIQRYGEDAATSEKLQRLEMLLIKIHSAIEASEKRTIENSWLLQWRDKLKEAASQSDDVLAIFLQRVKDSQATNNVEANQQQGEATSSSAAAPATGVGALSSTRNSMSSIVQGIGSATKMLFVSGDDDMERLNKVLARLEKLSPDIGEFIRLLHLEALARIVRPVRLRSPGAVSMSMRRSAKVHRPTKRVSFGLLPLEEKMKEMSAQCIKEEKSEHFLKSKCNSVCLPEEQGALVQGRLEAAFSEICKAVELADCHDLEGLKWLAYWNAIFREAKEQYWAILDAITVRKNVTTEDKEDLMVGGDQGKYELSSFVHRQEGLASDVEYFKKLVYLCPAC